MADWFWANAGAIPRPDEDLWLDLANVQLAQATRAFCANVLQIRQFWELPPYVLRIFAESLEAFTETAIRLTGKPKLDSEELARFHDQIISETQALLQRKVAALDYKNTAGIHFRRAIGAFNGIINDVPELAEAVRATLSSQLVLSWTAFETLCADLARAADTTGVLPESQTFQSLQKGIRKAYNQLFAGDAGIEEIVGDNNLRKLNIVRNVLVHTGGIVDQKSIDYAKAIGWTLPGEINKPFPVNGEIVRTLASPVIERGIELIRAVDRWLNAHPKEAG